MKRHTVVKQFLIKFDRGKSKKKKKQKLKKKIQEKLQENDEQKR